MYELQINDSTGPDLSFEFESLDEIDAFLISNYGKRCEGIYWRILDENGREVYA